MMKLGAGSLLADRFELESTAGSGGMGTVFRARDRYTGDRVALKLQHPSAGDYHEPERFLREAQMLSELRHPGIVSYVRLLRRICGCTRGTATASLKRPSRGHAGLQRSGSSIPA